MTKAELEAKVQRLERELEHAHAVARQLAKDFRTAEAALVAIEDAVHRAVGKR